MARLDSIPTGPHFAIIRTVSVYIPGDERSRTNPGHGYPEHTEEYISYEAFTDRAEWESRIIAMSGRHENFRAMSVTPAKVTATVTVSDA